MWLRTESEVCSGAGRFGATGGDQGWREGKGDKFFWGDLVILGGEGGEFVLDGGVCLFGTKCIVGVSPGGGRWVRGWKKRKHGR